MWSLTALRRRLALPCAGFVLTALVVCGCQRSRATHSAAEDAPPTSSEISRWVRRNAVPLVTVRAGNGFGDMEPLKAIVSDARVVAMGEATHGTKEFFQFKHRMFEFLVEKMGFTVFAIEANWPESLDINDYVVNGQGDPARVLAGLHFWTWNTEEVLDLIRWMRQYNLSPAHARKVKFYGFDMQFVGRAAEVVQAYLKATDPDYAARTASALDLLRRIQSLPDRHEMEIAWSGMDATVTEALERRFKEREQDYVSRTGRQEWHRAWRHARILSQGVRLFSGVRVGENKPRNLRDRFMAENIQWVGADEGPETRMMVWAHNGHVSLGAGNFWKPMGQTLKESVGSRLVVFGFAFGHGSFQAIDRTLDSQSKDKLRTFTVGPPPEGSLDATLAAVKIPLFVLDLRRAQGRVGRWMHSDHPTRNEGAVFVGPLSMLSPVVPAERYDALVFVNETSAARELGPPGPLTR